MEKIRNTGNEHVIQFLVEKRYRFFRHAVVLVLLFMMMYNGKQMESYSFPFNYISLFTTYFTFIIMFYINMYVLVPKFFFKSRYLLYIFSLGILVLGGIQFLSVMNKFVFSLYKFQNTEKMMYPDFRAVIIVCSSFIMVSTTIKLLQRWIKDSNRMNELKNLTYQMELDELKSQISPHFLFNMLNNVKALIRYNPEMAVTVLMKLSEFLRYQVYESSNPNTILASEVDFLSNFLNLEKIRKDNFHVDIQIDLSNTQLQNSQIPPGLFTVFIENALKHNHSTDDQPAYVKVRLNLEDRHLHFDCINTKNKPDHHRPNNKTNSGLGLANIKRRLDLLYENNYQLNLDEQENEYRVHLIIPI